MRYIFFDLETTGVKRSSDILEFGALVFDENLKLIEVVNQYYKCDDIPASATAVHGLTPVKLQMYNAIDWEKDAQRIYELVNAKDVILCGHNVMGYDIPVLKNNLETAGIVWNPDTTRVLDTMNMYHAKFSGSKSLSNATATATSVMSINLRKIEDMFRQSPLISQKIIDKTAMFHNALFDSYCSFVVYYSLLR